MNSVVWPGKLIGILIFESILERLGYRETALLVACIELLAIISMLFDAVSPRLI